MTKHEKKSNDSKMITNNSTESSPIYTDIELKLVKQSSSSSSSSKKRMSIREMWGMNVVCLIDHDGLDSSTESVTTKTRVVVQGVDGKDSPAGMAGVRSGDEITQVYGAPFANTKQLFSIMKHCANELVVTVRRKLLKKKRQVPLETDVSEEKKEQPKSLMPLKGKALEEEQNLFSVIRGAIASTSFRAGNVSQSKETSNTVQTVDFKECSDCKDASSNVLKEHSHANVDQKAERDVLEHTSLSAEKDEGRIIIDISLMDGKNNNHESVESSSSSSSSDSSSSSSSSSLPSVSSLSTSTKDKLKSQQKLSSTKIKANISTSNVPISGACNVQTNVSSTKQTSNGEQRKSVTILPLNVLSSSYVEQNNSKENEIVARNSTNASTRKAFVPAMSSTHQKSKKCLINSTNNQMLKRLWPDSFPFYKKILKWVPPKPHVSANGKFNFQGPIENVEGSQVACKEIPNDFKDAMEMLNCFVPFIISEAFERIKCVFYANTDRDKCWKDPITQCHIQSYMPLESWESKCHCLYELELMIHEAEVSQNLGDVYVLHNKSWKSPALAIVGVADPIANMYSRVDTDEYSIRLFVCVYDEPCSDRGWLPKSCLPAMTLNGTYEKQIIHLMRLGSVCTSIREYEGIKGTRSIGAHLKRVIYNKKQEKVDEQPRSNKEPVVKRPSCLSFEIWNRLKATLNVFQLSSVEKLMNGKIPNNFMLLQGPPGTGKTHTITQIVTALLNGGCPSEGKSNSGVKVTVGQSVSKGSVIGKNQNGLRILVCAPSNTAVDDLAWRIHTSSVGPDGQVGKLNIVRLGNTTVEEKADNRRFVKRGNSWQVDNKKKESFLKRISIDNMLTEATSFVSKRGQIITDSDIVCTTVSGTGSKALVESAYHRDSKSDCEFDVIIMDEACQVSEQASLIPLKYNPRVTILVGDPQQLPVFVQKNYPKKFSYGRSLFERLQKNGYPVEMLRYQYRMHPSIAAFPSTQFYSNQLINSKCVADRPPPPWYKHICFPPYLIWNVNGRMCRSSDGRGLYNKNEDVFILEKILSLLFHKFGRNSGKPKSVSIGIISFYNEQVNNIKRFVNDLKLDQDPNIMFSVEVSTVDGFQGSEKDIIILSCVRSKCRGGGGSNLGFLKDHRRMNVALTRAKKSLWIVGNCEVLAGDRVWRALLNWTDSKNLIAQADQFDRLARSEDKRSWESLSQIDEYISADLFRAKIKIRWSNGDYTYEPIAQVKEDDPVGLSAWVRKKGLDNHPLFSNCTRNIGRGKRGTYKRIKTENR